MVAYFRRSELASTLSFNEVARGALPDKPIWYYRLDEVIGQLENLTDPFVDRATLEFVLGVGRRRAQQILQPLVRRTEIPFSIDNRTILLVDDVLYTGRTTRAALDLSRSLNLELPITTQVHALLFEAKDPRQAIRDLMLRAPRADARRRRDRGVRRPPVARPDELATPASIRLLHASAAGDVGDG